MSWTFTVHKINQSFDQIAEWYHTFMDRTEHAFRALHERITYLENHQACQGPSDEQVERVLRKILAERFGEAGFQRVEPSPALKENAYFVKKPAEDECVPNPIQINTAMLHVDPDGVPSEAYRKQFKELDSNLSDFPNVDLKGSITRGEVEDIKPSVLATRRDQSPNNSQYTKPWS
ncbi:hypothetical protein BCR34DRAFT_485320 [Clohesyomyces aquaticus]|uniref:Uncharacterized protein n=1 Tax=Clohesyomyces aquaticus TaxID=1231657 RepID=A0A1Y1ZK99_9PLEO|nr:hypothetical protein BCR34DRAFT_485320 [Clohesyomyces aquaticus]